MRPILVMLGFLILVITVFFLAVPWFAYGLETLVEAFGEYRLWVRELLQ